MPNSHMQLMSNYSNLKDMRIVPSPKQSLVQGEVRLELDLFSLTANNITYAEFGDSIGFWKVFPTQHDNYGHMPVWGFANVIESLEPSIEVGTRVWGYFPMRNALIVKASKVTKFSFVDANDGRDAVPNVYARYTICHSNPFYTKETEAVFTMFRPLFITAYTASEFLKREALFGAKQVVITSASSKTAYSLAWCLKGTVPLIAVTSERNVDFVKGLGFYDKVVSYDDIENIPTNIPTLYADHSGDQDLGRRVYKHLDGSVVYNCLVGSTQANKFPDDEIEMDPKPIFFFAATVLDLHRKEKTLQLFLNRFEEAQLKFSEEISAGQNPKMEIVNSQGLESAQAVILDLINGKSKPQKGSIITL